MYKYMYAEDFNRFYRAAKAFADISGESECRSQIVVDFFHRYSDSFVKYSARLPSFFTIVYEVGKSSDGSPHSVVYHSCYLPYVRVTDKFIEFEDGRRVRLSKVFFFIY